MFQPKVYLLVYLSINFIILNSNYIPSKLELYFINSYKIQSSVLNK